MSKDARKKILRRLTLLPGELFSVRNYGEDMQYQLESVREECLNRENLWVGEGDLSI